MKIVGVSEGNKGDQVKWKLKARLVNIKKLRKKAKEKRKKKKEEKKEEEEENIQSDNQ